jgi:aerobic-type carbon monoxide dehydrogenase small subunit (CoxS/CutS family)
MKKTVSIAINGEPYQAEVPLRLLLVDFIRDVAGLTGTHVACTWEGRCGACTVLLNGEAVKSCMVLAVQADGEQLTTVEGLADGAELHPLQEAFSECDALQCGYCTGGMLMTALDLLKDNPEPTADEVRRGLVGTLCRCTGYAHIVDAVQAGARRMREVRTQPTAAR